jgi:tyrosyl-tRNA synthetase
VLNSDLTIIGSDQLFNEMLGRFYQEKFGQQPQVIMTTRITPGIDGKAKQSKSLDNYIGLGHSPRDKFGRTMRVPDSLIPIYFQVYTEVPEPELQALENLAASDPLEAKKRLAVAIVARYHGEQVAREEREWFGQTFSQRQIPADIPSVTVEAREQTAFDVVRQFFGSQKSNNELRRLFQQGGVTLNGAKITNPAQSLTPTEGDVLQVGKRKWFRLHVQ